MIDPTALLRTCLETLLDLSGARSVTLYLPPVSAGLQASLIHVGDQGLPPEFEGWQSSIEPWVPADDPGGSIKSVRIVASSDADALLAYLPSSGSQRTTALREPPHAPAPAGWLGLRFAPGQRPAMPLPSWRRLFDLAAALAEHAADIAWILKDPTTGLPVRLEFQSMLVLEIDRSRQIGRRLGLLLINPDDFGSINDTYGNEAGDQAIREIANLLRHASHAYDLPSRYGGATFALILRDTTADEAEKIAHDILRRISRPGYLDGSLKLDFSIGVALFEPEQEDLRLLDFVRRADQALSVAKRSSGNAVVLRDSSSKGENIESFDRMAGIFTGDVAKDYRNMVLLWDTVGVMASNESLDQLAKQTVERLFEVLRPDGVGLFTPGPEGEPILLVGLTGYRRGSGSQVRLETLEIDRTRAALLREALELGLPRDAHLPVAKGKEDASAAGSSSPSQRCYAVPLIAGDAPLGSLFIEWSHRPTHFDASDLVFLNALALQLAIAWDRVRLVELEMSRQELEKRKLRAELKRLRDAVHQARLVYKSPQMEELMHSVRRVAPTDATVLLYGPSGTGKELLARTIHELSPRRDQPLISVDCGAIPTTLIESELFGHERGAYTGAESRRDGRLAEAHQGTVLLDEIGELPLEVQSKLLRFVQEKQVTSVGGSNARTVDLRILAATNRNLVDEVAAGRFREDLYYRLNVIALAVPPLRDRNGDVLHLARHFLEIYSVQYQKDIHEISNRAKERLVAHTWPGNVRELQNRVIQAVLLCEGPVVTARDLGLEDDRDGTLAPPPAATAPRASRFAAAEPETTAFEGSAKTTFEELAYYLGDLVSDNRRGADGPPPVGTWLADELLLAADDAAGGVKDRGAALVDLAPTTYRRRLAKAQERRSAGAVPPPEAWEHVRETIERLIGRVGSGQGPGDLLGLCERLLLSEIVTQWPGNTRIGAALLGVTKPTFRRRAEQLGRPFPSAPD